MEPASVTVIIPTLCRAERRGELLRAIDSVNRGGKLISDILVIVNGREFDAGLVDEVRRSPHVRVGHAEAANLPAAIHYGRTLVETEFFAFLNDDDEYLPGALETRLAPLAADPSLDAVVTNGYRGRDNREQFWRHDLETIRRDPLHALLSANWLASCGGLFRTALVPPALFTDWIRHCEWSLLAFRLVIHGFVHFLPDMTFRAHDGGSFSSESERREAAEAGLLLAHRMLSFPLPPDVEQILRQRLPRELHAACRACREAGDLKAAWAYHVRSIKASLSPRYIFYSPRLLVFWLLKGTRHKISENVLGSLAAVLYAGAAMLLHKAAFNFRMVPRFMDIYLVGILLMEYLFSWRPAGLLLLISIAIGAYLVPPSGSFRIAHGDDVFRLVSFSVVSIAGVALIHLLKRDLEHETVRHAPSPTASGTPAGFSSGDGTGGLFSYRRFRTVAPYPASLPRNSGGAAPPVTIIIPTLCRRERRPLLMRAIGSLAGQAGVSYRVLLAVNGKEFDPDLLAELAAAPSVDVLRIEEASLPNALRHAREAVGTEFFGFLDDDDEYLPGALETRLAPLRADPSLDAVVTNGYIDRGAGQELWQPDSAAVRRDPLGSLLAGNNWLASCGALFRSRSVAPDCFHEWILYREWTVLAFRMVTRDLSVCFLPDITFRVNDSPGSLSKSRAAHVAMASALVVHRMLSFPLPEDLRDGVYRRLADELHDAAAGYLQMGDLPAARRCHISSLQWHPTAARIAYTWHVLRAC